MHSVCFDGMVIYRQKEKKTCQPSRSAQDVYSRSFSKSSDHKM